MKPTELPWSLPATINEIVALQRMAQECSIKAMDADIPHFFVTYNDLKKVDGFKQSSWDNGRPFRGIRGRIGLIEHTFRTIIDGHGEVVFVNERELTIAGVITRKNRIDRMDAVRGVRGQHALPVRPGDADKSRAMIHKRNFVP